MATLADSFLQDLEDLEDDDVRPEQEKKQLAIEADRIAAKAKEDGEADGDVGDQPTRISKMVVDTEFTSLIDEVRRRKDEQTDFSEGKQLSEDDEEYKLINRCNNMVREIDEELLTIHRFVRDTYSKKFPELESIVINPLEYLVVVQRAGNAKDLNQVDFSDILPNNVIMAITITASMTQRSLLPDDQMELVHKGCEDAFTLNDCKRDVLLYLESRMSGLAPNLSALLGAALAAKLITSAGGLLALARMPAQNIMLIGASKQAKLGMAGHMAGQSLMMFSDIVHATPLDYRKRAIKLVSGKCGLAARVDSFRESPLGQVGTQLREQIVTALRKAQEPPPAKQKKALPIPEDKPRPKRGGKRHRRMKEKYGQSEIHKQAQRINFGPNCGEDVNQEDLGFDLGMINHGESKFRAKLNKEKQMKMSQAAQKRQRQAAAAGQRADGMSSSLAFTPVQGLELANPEARREKKAKVDPTDKYFASDATFVKLSL
eukprot:GEMP01019116.1.p1 GENE.GEMP01019116.1~~GEMP01019116.1.p1  ORF type:complete len:488 (+),score=125.79 GEMP01019116.1:39-1502(+)